MSLEASDPRHGTYNGYKNLGCRCDRCRAAHTVYVRERTHRVGIHRPREVYLQEARAKALLSPHGTETKYRYHGCRCDECKAASRDARRRRRAAA